MAEFFGRAGSPSVCLGELFGEFELSVTRMASLFKGSLCLGEKAGFLGA